MKPKERRNDMNATEREAEPLPHVSEREALLKALIESRRIVADSLAAFGDCDHSVGICNCDMKRSIEASDEAIARAALSGEARPAQDAAGADDYRHMSEQLTRAKNLLVRIHSRHPEARALIEGSTGSWFVWGTDRDAIKEPAPASVAPGAVSEGVPQEAPDLEELRRAICGIGIVGRIDGHELIRRDSVIDLIDRRRHADR